MLLWSKKTTSYHFYYSGNAVGRALEAIAGKYKLTELQDGQKTRGKTPGLTSKIAVKTAEWMIAAGDRLKTGYEPAVR